MFLCHAWDDRKDAATELKDALESHGISVWFSETTLRLGTPMMRAIDRGLARSRAGLVLVTPSLLERLNADGVADKELAVLLNRDLVAPILHETTFEELNDVSPLLASRAGLSTKEDSFVEIVVKVQELLDFSTPTSEA